MLIRRAAQTAVAVILSASALVVVADVAVAATDACGRAPSSRFTHPGVFQSATQLTDIRQRVRSADTNPQTNNMLRTYQTLQKDPRAATTYHPLGLDHAAPITLQQSDNSSQDFYADAIAAYTQALEYDVDGDAVYANNVAAILNSWKGVKGVSGNGAVLNAAWALELMPRAAEILCWKGPNALDAAGFNSLLGTIRPYLEGTTPEAQSSMGNWELSMADAMMNIGVYKNNTDAYAAGIAMWHARVPAYIYRVGDNNGNGIPVYPPGNYYTTPVQLSCYWTAQAYVPACRDASKPALSSYFDGQSQETCRDMSHVTDGFEALAYAAETARIQHDDLWGSELDRIVTGVETNAAWLDYALQHPTGDGGTTNTSPKLCNTNFVDFGGTGYRYGWQTVFNELNFRRHIAMPNTTALLVRIGGSDLNHPFVGAALHMAWEALTSFKSPA